MSSPSTHRDFTVAFGSMSPMESLFSIREITSSNTKSFELLNRNHQKILDFRLDYAIPLPSFGEEASVYILAIMDGTQVTDSSIVFFPVSQNNAIAVVYEDGVQGVWASRAASRPSCGNLPENSFSIVAPEIQIFTERHYIHIEERALELRSCDSETILPIQGAYHQTPRGQRIFWGFVMTESDNKHYKHHLCLVFDSDGYRVVGVIHHPTKPDDDSFGGSNTLVFGGESDGGLNYGYVGTGENRGGDSDESGLDDTELIGNYFVGPEYGSLDKMPPNSHHREPESNEPKPSEKRPPDLFRPFHPKRTYNPSEVKMSEPLSRELLMASKLVTQAYRPPRSPADSFYHYEISLEASEPGWADLSRLQLLAVDRDLKYAKTVDVLPWTTVEAIRVHNTRELIRGQGHTLGAPAGPFSPFRQYGPIQLGQWWLEGGNLITIRVRTEIRRDKEDRSDKGNCKPDFAYSAAVPFLPDNPRHYRCPHDLSNRDRAYVASQAYEVSCHGEEAKATLLEFKFDQDGIVDLDTLQVQVRHREPTDYDTPPVATAIVESIELPTRQELIVGGSYGGGTNGMENGLAAPGGIFASLGRRFEWVRFGKLDVSTRNTLRVRVRLLKTEHGKPAVESTLSAGIQFYPSKKRTH